MTVFKSILDGVPSSHSWNVKIPGWCVTEKAMVLAGIVATLRPEVSLEIGVYGGSSFLPIALAHKMIGRGIAIGIDPWSNATAMREQTREIDREWWSSLDLEKIYTGFMENIKLHGLEKFVRIHRNESRNVPPPNQIGLLHVDGSHGDTAVGDMMKFAPKVHPGGFCVTDDTTWHGGAVARGEQRLIGLGFKKLYALGTGAVFQRI